MRTIRMMVVTVWTYSFFQSLLSAAVNTLPSFIGIVLLCLSGSVV
jgi:hypothetical protein